MVDTHSRGYLLAARRMFWSGAALFGLGLAAGWSATGHWATSWNCDPTCRPETSTMWHVIDITARTAVVLGTALAVSAFLMIMLRRPRPRPGSSGPRATE
ncbi:hypothetical protein [Streptomyces sp. NPDC001787]|uniref:hypothetical protein n=1 Tax=Streptomyces sp. NPDC001787 TaxID=3154523 RepID=UPI0033296E9B